MVVDILEQFVIMPFGTCVSHQSRASPTLIQILRFAQKSYETLETLGLVDRGQWMAKNDEKERKMLRYASYQEYHQTDKANRG